MAAIQLMWACGLRLVSSDLSEYSFTDLREDGQLSWLLACGEWFRPLHDSNPGRFQPRGFVALRLNHSATPRTAEEKTSKTSKLRTEGYLLNE